jgi:hypothetical protein
LEETTQRMVTSASWHDAVFDSAACLLLFFKLLELAEIAPDSDILLRPPDLSEYFARRRKGQHENYSMVSL